jgi:hypothetical protein
MYFFLKNKKKIKFLLLFLAFFSYGFLSGLYKFFPYHQIKFLYSKTLKNINLVDKKNNFFEECNITISNNVLPNSIVFIGHAYGSPNESDLNDFISKKVLNFLLKNSDKLDKVIFTGDIFKVPSLKKWDELNKIFNDKLEVHVAPGNHDIERPDSKDIFTQTKFGNKHYPYTIDLTDYILIIDDSISSNWEISLKTVLEIKKNINKVSLVARHNPPIKELMNYVNSLGAYAGSLSNFKKLKSLIPINNEVIWIIGDSGAFDSLPRIKCLKKENHTFILNGIGDIKNDTIIFLSNNKLYSYILE